MLRLCAAFLMVWFTAVPASAQDGGGAAEVDAGASGVTLELDPSAMEGVSVIDAADDGPTMAEEPMGPVAEAMEEAIPATGVEAVDSATGTLSRSIGGLVDSTVSYLPQLVIALLVLVATGFLAALATKLLRKSLGRAHLRPSLRDLIVMAARILIWFAGLMLAAGIVFPSFGFGNLVATAGLASIAIGFAFQDIFENFFAGVLILWSFPFEEGDFIHVPSEDLIGKVEHIEIRMTHLRRTTGELVLVPNATIYKNTIEVFTSQPKRRITVMCGIAYGEDVAEGRRVMREAVATCDTVVDPDAIEVYAQAFGASSIDFEVTWWAKPTPRDQRVSRDQVVEAVKKALDDAGIEIPYPYRTLTFSKNEPDIIAAVAGRSGGSGGASGEGGG